MGTVLLGVAVVAALACPVHMCWRMRRGAAGGCLPSSARGDDATAVAERQAVLSEHLATGDAAPPAGSAGQAGYASRQ